jgi:uncharacterized protein YbaR (Trm112 family)
VPTRAWTWAALMHRAFDIDVLACPHCGGRLRLIATLHDPAIGRSSRTEPSATRGRIPAPAHPSLAPPRPDPIRSGALRTLSCPRREVAFVRSRPVRRPIDSGGVSRLACSSPGPARSTREEAAYVRCGIGFWGGQCLSVADYVGGPAATRAAPAAAAC